MASTLVTMTAFQKWTEERGAYYNQYEKARNKLLSQIDNLSQSDANALSNTLNNLIANQSFKEEQITSKLLNRLPSVLSASGENALQKIDITDNFKVSTDESGTAWAAYISAINEYKQMEMTAEEQVSAEENAKKLLSKALSIQGSLNKVQGDVFEAFLQESIPLLSKKIEKFGDDQATLLIKNLSQSLGQKVEISTQGSQHETVTFTFDDKVFKISSQGKIDVNVPAPFLDINFPLKISAKNYSSLRHVHLLSGGSALGLISQWPTSQAAKNYFINALTVWNSPEEVLAQGRILFAIQSLAGRGGKNELANVLIVNVRNNKKRPIRALSTGALLKEVTTKNIDNIFQIKFAPQLQLFKSGEYRDKQEFKDRLTSLTIDTTLNKKYLYISELSKLI